jgi:peptide chain release factor 1
MLPRLQEVERRFEELSAEMQNPQVFSDPRKLQQVARERKGLEKLVSSWRELRRLDQEIDEYRQAERGEDRELATLAAGELPGLEQKRVALLEEIRVLLLPRDPLDEKNTMLEIRSGTGGEEASLFAADLLRMYLRYAESRRWKTEIMNASRSATGGIKEVVVLLSGDAVYSHLKWEGGVHRVQRVPVTESQGRIHTSTVTVAVLPEADEIDIQLDERDLDISVMRAGGPGGQGVNTTDSAVRIVHKPTGITIHCQDERSQIKNKEKAKKILRARLYEMELSRRHQEQSEQRRSMVGSGERAEKIRTYNFPQNRVTDHRIGLTLHKLDRVMDGALDELLEALKTHYQMEALQGKPT